MIRAGLFVAIATILAVSLWLYVYAARAPVIVLRGVSVALIAIGALLLSLAIFEGVWT